MHHQGRQASSRGMASSSIAHPGEQRAAACSSPCSSATCSHALALHGATHHTRRPLGSLPATRRCCARIPRRPAHCSRPRCPCARAMRSSSSGSRRRSVAVSPYCNICCSWRRRRRGGSTLQGPVAGLRCTAAMSAPSRSCACSQAAASTSACRWGGCWRGGGGVLVGAQRRGFAAGVQSRHAASPLAACRLSGPTLLAQPPHKQHPTPPPSCNAGLQLPGRQPLEPGERVQHPGLCARTARAAGSERRFSRQRHPRMGSTARQWRPHQQLHTGGG